HEPGCAVRAAVENDALSQRRVNNYTKLMAGQERNAASIAEQRKKDKATARFHKKVLAHKKSGKDV
ncbi:MAG: GTPase RsgA, partial [Alphaproteobacteria bacterium]|nr:GTPase RsgA [Alphaproteobacteria bacterium]